MAGKQAGDGRVILREARDEVEQLDVPGDLECSRSDGDLGATGGLSGSEEGGLEHLEDLPAVLFLSGRSERAPDPFPCLHEIRVRGCFLVAFQDSAFFPAAFGVLEKNLLASSGPQKHSNTTTRTLRD